MSNKVEVVTGLPVVAADLTPMALMQSAVTAGANIETLERLMALQERWQANEARRKFTEALSALRGDLPQILKSKTVDFSTSKGRTHYKYEDLSEVVEQLSPVLSQHGLSFRWRTDSATPGYVGVTLILSHKDGHSEETSLSGPYDTSGNKNPIQAIGSVVTYLQRYSLKCAIGIAAGVDDDGRQGAPQGQPAGQDDPPNPPPQTDMASEKQIELVKTLAKSHVLTPKEKAGIQTRVDAGMSKKQASDAIEWLQTTTKERKKAAADAETGSGALPFDDADAQAEAEAGAGESEGQEDRPSTEPAGASTGTPEGGGNAPVMIGTEGSERVGRLLRQYGLAVDDEDALVAWMGDIFGITKFAELDEAQEKAIKAWIQERGAEKQRAKAGKGGRK